VKLSVVIPTLNEAEHIEATIHGALHAPFEGLLAAPDGSALAVGGGAAPGLEVIVVDGGSRDRTPELVEPAGARLIRTPGGRALQLAAGARASTGDVLVFLHADTRLPAGWGVAVCAALEDERVIGGAFRLTFDWRSPRMRFIEWGARQRVRFFGLPYGDQALFVRRAALAAVGGVPQQPILEDLDLVRKLKAHGKLALLELPVVTSARRYRAGGPLRTMLHHWRIAAGWALGVDRERLARWARR
jgi:rSAM/selenodomain-associated transferase 2